jgi:hypothetical protein
MAHLIDDETVAKMGHPVVVVRSDVGHPSKCLCRGCGCLMVRSKSRVELATEEEGDLDDPTRASHALLRHHADVK